MDWGCGVGFVVVDSGFGGGVGESRRERRVSASDILDNRNYKASSPSCFFSLIIFLLVVIPLVSEFFAIEIRFLGDALILGVCSVVLLILRGVDMMKEWCSILDAEPTP